MTGFTSASCTKAMVATIAATFVEEGRMMGYPSSDVFPDSGTPSIRTIANHPRDLLTHRAGLPPVTWGRIGPRSVERPS